MVNVQEYIDKKYPAKEDKVNCRELVIAKKNENRPEGVDEVLEGSLSLKDFVNLKVLNCQGHKISELKNLCDCPKLEILRCAHNELSSLELTGLTQLKSLVCSNNYLTSLNFSGLNPNTLNFFSLYNNNLISQDLKVFEHFVNLSRLFIGNDDEEKIKRGIYNRFYGSLEPLKNLDKLKSLHISNTDIDSGSEYLPKSLDLNEIYFSTEERSGCRLRLIEKKIKLLKGELIDAQTYLDNNYPKEERANIKGLYVGGMDSGKREIKKTGLN